MDKKTDADYDLELCPYCFVVCAHCGMPCKDIRCWRCGELVCVDCFYLVNCGQTQQTEVSNAQWD